MALASNQHLELLQRKLASLSTTDLCTAAAIVTAATVWTLKDKIWEGKKEEKQSRYGYRKKIGQGNTRDLVQSIANEDKNLIVLYGSQSGVAEDLAARLAREGSSRFGLKTMAVSLEDYDYDNLNEFPRHAVAIFVMATFGEGEPTDNAQDFYNFITADDVTFRDGSTASTSPSPLSSLHFVSFGLGNSTYEHFNAVSKKIDATLARLGAQRVAPTGRGDDGEKTTEEDFLAWKQPMWTALAKHLGVQEREVVYEPTFAIIERDDLTKTLNKTSSGDSSTGTMAVAAVAGTGAAAAAAAATGANKVFLGEPNLLSLQGQARGPYNAHNPYVAPVTSSRQLFRAQGRNCLHLEIDLAGSGLRYEAGDHVSVFPVNSGREVDRFLRVFGLAGKRDTVVDVKPIERTAKVSFPVPTTYDTIARYRLEIGAPVSRQLLQQLVAYAPSPAARANLTKLAADKDLFHHSVTERRMNIAQVLELASNDKPWADVPFTMLIESLIALQPRHYSISSSPALNKDRLTITTKVETHAIADTGFDFKGVATNYLLALQQAQNLNNVRDSHKDNYASTYAIHGPRNRYQGLRLPVCIRPSTFRLPRDPAVPVIMIGPGTGVAPFRGFVQERIAQKKAGRSVGLTFLFYGCRSKADDYIYEEVWKESEQTLGPNFKMITAFSRAVPGQKTYVQDKLREHAAQVTAQLVNHGAYLYVCGDVAMAKDVNVVLEHIVADKLKLSLPDAVAWVKQLRTTNRYQEDAWS
ncbi:hypothetical protein A1O3_06699 [Capronia epimyces CBS 606.96]|uniref:NADPH--cytochrome P450 reductase n=1 Tax=Capronia epimyces CBS 606.96 TaxID=1182542 RepID=W9XRR1_9EURO|nr:uncharacterized protein A1O3_06699 [Capronia epimyces CBS 606.96]EXJ82883.1 hypothetical protein A1O3_06699 [Capronia epimyces CBS 606.96]